MYDAVVVGARCAGSIAAGILAREGWKVLLVDKARFPSDTVSTHYMFPNSLARLERLGILERLHGRHKLPSLAARWRVLGHEIEGTHSEIEGHSRGTSVRRVALDAVFVEWARDAGAETRFGTRVGDLVREEDDRVAGVVLEGGEEIRARWVIGADGRASTVASALGLEKEQPKAGDQAFLFAYWTGLPERDFFSIDVDDANHGLMWNPSEDDIHLLSVAGKPDFTRGSAADRERSYMEGLRAFPESLDPSLLDRAERISDLVVVPETMMRGFYRSSNGPGWALVGDAGHFKHPATAQGISDAIEQAVFVAEALTGADPDLERYPDWRRDRSAEHYEFSFLYGSWPLAELADPYLRGLASDPAAKQEWLDVFTRAKRPSDVDTDERLTRWFAPT